MGYLNMDSSTVDDFIEAVISVWFIVGHDAIDQAQADWTKNIELDDPLGVLESGIIPLVSWGPQPSTSVTAVTSDRGSTETLTGQQASSCIGVFCGYALELDKDAALTHNLYTRLQFTNGLTSLFDNNDIPPEKVGVVQCDFFQVGGYAFGSVIGTDYHPATFKDVVVDPDIWHHALISFSISGASAQFWQALDDKDYTDDGHLAPYGEGSSIKTAHNGITAQGFDGSVGGGPVPCSGKPLGLPGASNRTDFIQHCEMAYFQMFTGVSLDTSVTSNRRMFVDEDGKPVNPNKKSTKDDQQSGSIEGLGQRPDILFRSSSNWVKGRNTGALGVDDDGKLITSGQFEPMGDIKPYKPDAKLGVAAGSGGGTALLRRAGPPQLSQKRRKPPPRRRSSIIVPKYLREPHFIIRP